MKYLLNGKQVELAPHEHVELRIFLGTEGKSMGSMAVIIRPDMFDPAKAEIVLDGHCSDLTLKQLNGGYLQAVASHDVVKWSKNVNPH